MAEYRSIKNICFIKYTHTKTDHRKREPQTLVIREVMAKCYERRYFNDFTNDLFVCAPSV